MAMGEATKKEIRSFYDISLTSIVFSNSILRNKAVSF